MPPHRSQQRIIQNFWNHVHKTETCWEYQAKAHDKYGYRRFYIGYGNYVYVHRFSWILKNGQVPAGMMICHKCDNTQCVRPSHLFLGTPKDNVQDCMRKGRWNSGM